MVLDIKACGLSLYVVGKGEHYFLDAAVFDALRQKRHIQLVCADFFKGGKFASKHVVFAAPCARFFYGVDVACALDYANGRFRARAIFAYMANLAVFRKTAAYRA